MEKAKKFGTFGGVFTPSILTILGVIMYMRMGAVVGNSSTLWMTLAIVVFAHIVSITTGLSVSSVATDKKIKAGGIYYMLSRSLGFSIGGAIGITIFIATALSISLYLIGFGESALLAFGDYFGIESITTNHLRIVGGAALVLVVTLAMISTSLAIKAQYVILFLIVLSMVSIGFGSSEGLEPGNDGIANPSFALLFGIFFPAVTGFTAGIAMSGDLKDPKKSIPWGTLLAIVTGLVVYVVLAIFLYYSIDGNVLATNNNAIVEFAWIPALVVIGIWGATLSSALGGILGAPRILQAMSHDKITPRFFQKGVGVNNEPRNALILTGVIALMGIMIGELNAIAEIVAMFYMAAYLFINLSCFLEQWASPDFRPSFRINLMIPLIGAVATFLLMIQLNLAAALVSILVMVLLFLWLARKQLNLGSGDVWNSVWSSVVKMGLKNLQKKSTHKRNWEPNILLFTGGSSFRNELIAVSKSIAGRNGMVSNFDLIENPSAKVLLPKSKQIEVADKKSDDTIFYRQQECNNVYRGIENIANSYGFSGIDPNTVLMGWGRNTGNPKEFGKMSDYLSQLDYNVLYLDYDKEKGFGNMQTIDIWWTHFAEYCDLTLHLAKLINFSSEWGQAKLRILYQNNDNSAAQFVQRAIESKVDNARITTEIVVVNNEIEQKSVYELVRSYSLYSDLILLELPHFEDNKEIEFVDTTNNLLKDIGTTLVIRASSHFYEDINLSPSLQKEYDLVESQISFLTKVENVKIVQTNSDELNIAIDTLYESLQQLHFRSLKRMYQKFEEVFIGLSNVMKETLDNNDTATHDFVPQLLLCFEDFKSNRIPELSKEIDHVLDDTFTKIPLLIDRLPESFIKKYTAEELKLSSGSPFEIARIKKKLSSKKQQQIALRKVASHHSIESYLAPIHTALNVVGVSGFVLNKLIQSWINQGNWDVAQLQVSLSEQIKKEHLEGVNRFGLLGRQFCNSIVEDCERINIKNITIEREENASRSDWQGEKQALRKYAVSFEKNQRLFTNFLVLGTELNLTRQRLLSMIQMHGLELSEDYFTVIQNVVKTLQKDFIKAKGQQAIKEAEFPDAQLDEDLMMLSINREVKEIVNGIAEELHIIADDSLNHFEEDQKNVAQVTLSIRKTVQFILDQELIQPFGKKANLFVNEIHSEYLKTIRAIKLLNFALDSVVKDVQAIEQLKEGLKNQLEGSLNSIALIKQRFDNELQSLKARIAEVLQTQFVVAKSVQSSKSGLSGVALEGTKGYLKRTRGWLRKWGERIDQGLIKLRDTVSKSSFEHRTRSLQNLSDRLAEFSDGVRLNTALNEKFPYYYQQLFTGKQTAPDKPLEHRKQELQKAKLALNRYYENKSGAVLFTGEVLCGKTYVMNNAVNCYGKSKPFVIENHSLTRQAPHEILRTSLERSTGFSGTIDEIMAQFEQDDVLVISDLERWWSRTDRGNDLLYLLKDWIRNNCHKVLFVIDCNIHFYAMAKHLVGIDDVLIATIVVAPLPTNAIRDIILKRHSNGGMQFFWGKKNEESLKYRQVNRLFTRLTSTVEGNIGAAMHLWLGNVEKIVNNTLYLGRMDPGEITFQLKPEWELLLYQVLLHKQITRRQLEIVHGKYDYEIDIEQEINNLIKGGLVVQNLANELSINPYLVVFVTKYLRNNQIIN